jgi:hypothetical protein
MMSVRQFLRLALDACVLLLECSDLGFQRLSIATQKVHAGHRINFLLASPFAGGAMLLDLAFEVDDFAVERCEHGSDLFSLCCLARVIVLLPICMRT